MSATAERTEAEELVEFFAEGWRIGASDPERFYAHFASRLAPDALMTQPLAAPVRGPAGLRELFAPLFAAMPDFVVEVERWGATDDGVLIEIRLSGGLDGKPIAWTAVDRLVLRDGLIAARHSYFDPLPVLRAFARRPRAGARLLRTVLGRGR